MIKQLSFIAELHVKQQLTLYSLETLSLELLLITGSQCVGLRVFNN